MSFEQSIAKDLDYETYRFGRSRQRYRGPKPDLQSPYVAMIGGSETFGKFSPKAYPGIVEDLLDYPVANWGTPGAGPGFFLRDPVLLEACSCAQVCVISVMGAHPVSNRLYTVFKRRNARLRGSSEMLNTLFPEVDIEDFRFVRNMLNRLQMTSEDKFKVVELEIRAAWIARMRDLLESIETRRVLFWMSSRTPEDASGKMTKSSMGVEPAMVDRQMIDAISPYVDDVVEFVAQPQDHVDAGDVLVLSNSEQENERNAQPSIR
jgi:hypothetical protein